MDERQTKIREGAGLEESRLNQDFIDLLRKWSTPVLVLVAVSALAYLGWQKYEAAQQARVGRAFVELEAAGPFTNANPESLKRVAEEYSGVRGVAVQARLRAADAYLQAIDAGLRTGASAQPDGTYAADDILSDAERERYLAEAESLFDAVLKQSDAKAGGALNALNALYGLAAVAESRSQLDKARDYLERARQTAELAGFDEHVAVARGRIESLPKLTTAAVLPSKAELPRLPWEPAPIPPVSPPMPAPGPTGAASAAPTGTEPTTPATAPTGAPPPAPASTDPPAVPSPPR